MFRTKDGKLWPYQPGSSKQLGWVDLIVGTPGSGKSFAAKREICNVILLTDDDIKNAPSSVDPKASATEYCTKIVLLDREVRNAASLLRDIAPEAGRSVEVGARLRF